MLSPQSKRNAVENSCNKVMSLSSQAEVAASLNPISTLLLDMFSSVSKRRSNNSNWLLNKVEPLSSSGRNVVKDILTS